MSVLYLLIYMLDNLFGHRVGKPMRNVKKAKTVIPFPKYHIDVTIKLQVLSMSF